MSSESLKARAKRLRPAIAKMFGVSVSQSQSLELVAKEENYPHWDAASACADKSQPKPQAAVAPWQANITVHSGWPPTLLGIFGEYQNLSDELLTMLTAPGEGALILIGSPPGNGKSVTAHVLAEAIHAGDSDKQASFFVEVKEFTYPPEVEVREFDNPESIFTLSMETNQLIVVDEIRDSEVAFKVVSLVQAGMKVIATMHAGKKAPVVSRLEALLCSFGVGKSVLDGLLEQGQVRSIFQELVWTEDAHPAQARAERTKSIMHRAGIDEGRIDHLISLDDNKAILEEVVQSTKSTK